MPIVLCCWLLTFGLGFSKLTLASPQSAKEWVDKMAEAVHSLNYRGTFIYLHEQHIEAMQIWHRAEDSRERLITLNGAVREVVRNHEQMMCVQPAVRSVRIDRTHPKNPFAETFSVGTDQLMQNYRFTMTGMDRVAGHFAHIIEVEPKDQLRYGYRLWLEQSSAMPLKSALLDGKKNALEQVVFTAIEWGVDIPNKQLEPTLAGDRAVWNRTQTGVDQKITQKYSRAYVNPIPNWFENLPAGFKVTSYQTKHTSFDQHSPMEHWVFSDGLATISVFIERHKDDAAWLDGVVNMGAVNVFGLHRSGYQITAVGEVPKQTVKRFSLLVASHLDEIE